MLFAFWLTAMGAASATETVGWVERVRLYPGDVEVEAKIDTGADQSSVDCNCINFVERNGAKYVNFKVMDINGKLHTFERKIKKYIYVKQHTGDAQRRPEVTMGICLGGTYRTITVNLTNRANYRYPVLVGRKFLSGRFTVDPGRRYTTEPRCPGAPKDE